MNLTLIEQDQLKTALREWFGACEIRFYDSSVTVTCVKEFGKHTTGSLRSSVETCLDNIALGNVDGFVQFDIEVVSANRFKLYERKDVPHPSEAVENTIDLEIGDDFDDGEDFRETIDVIRNAVDVAHEESMLKQALIKAVERDTEDFIAKNIGSAMAIFKTNRHVVSLDETKELLRFGYISGLWANARERDLEVLIEVFNGKFKAYTNEWTLEHGDDEAGHA